MKKSKIIILSIVFIIILFIIIAVVLSMNGYIGAGEFSAKTYSTLGSEVSDININVRDRDINIISSQDEQIYINYFVSEKEYYDINLTNNVLNINFIDKKSWIDHIGLKPSIDNRKIEIRIPNNLISNINISTTNENISISDLSIQNNLTLNSNGGDVKISSIQVGSTISLTTKNGSISGSIVGSWDEYSIDCTIKKGETNLPSKKPEGSKHLITNCNNGDINISFINS